VTKIEGSGLLVREVDGSAVSLHAARC